MTQVKLLRTNLAEKRMNKSFHLSFFNVRNNNLQSLAAILYAASDRGLVDADEVQTTLGLSREETITANISGLSIQSRKYNIIWFSQFNLHIKVSVITGNGILLSVNMRM